VFILILEARIVFMLISTFFFPSTGLAKKQFFSSLFFLFGTLEMGVFGTENVWRGPRAFSLFEPKKTKLILTGLDLPFIVVNTASDLIFN